MPLFCSAPTTHVAVSKRTQKQTVIHAVCIKSSDTYKILKLLLVIMDFQQKVEAAYDRVKSLVWKTPLAYSYNLSALTDSPVYLKMESEQVTGSYKVRGAFNKMIVLCEQSEDTKNHGVMVASSGNFGIACAYAGSKLKVPYKIFVPTAVSKAKLNTLNLMKAEVELFGADCVDAEIKARSTAEEKGLPYMSAYNDIDVVHGQGTIGYEIYRELAEVDCVLVPVGGGGVIGGIAGYLKSVKPSIQIIGCQPKNSKVMYESIQAGKIIFEESLDTLSDGTAGGLEDNSITFDLCEKFVDEWILVGEDEIAKAMYFMLEHHHKVVEGAAGVSVGAFLKDPERFKSKNTVIVCSGSNIAMDILTAVVESQKLM